MTSEGVSASSSTTTIQSKTRTVVRRRLPRVMRAINKVIAYSLMISMVFCMAFPLVFMVFSSLKTEGENLSYPPTFIPREWTLVHYKVLFTQTMFPLWFRNSLIVAVGTMITAIAISAMGAYVFSRFRYRSFEYFSRFILFAYMVPTVLLLIPVFRIVHSLKLSNTR